jgi:hypothetical protein
MKTITRRSLKATVGLLALHVGMMSWDISRVTDVSAPLWTIPILKGDIEKSSTSIGLGYVVTMGEEIYDIGEKELLRMHSYELKHWVMPWRIAFAGAQ